MEIKVKQQILKYLKDCITEDTKEELSIEIESKDINKINSRKIFFPDRNIKSYSDENISFESNDIDSFFDTLKKDGLKKEDGSVSLQNIDTLEIGEKEFFIKQCYSLYKSKSSWDQKNGPNKNIATLIDFIKWDNNSLRKQIIKQINNHVFYTNSDKEYLDSKDLEELFFAGDKNKDIEKIEFFGNGDFIDFYDTNKNEKIYLCLENIVTERNKKLIFQPLYFVEVEIQEDTTEHFFTLSLSETNVSFNFYLEHYGKKLFKLENKQEKEEGFELEKDIEGLSNFESKIDLYKSKITKTFDKTNINKNTCLISANDIAFIKGLLKEYNDLIENKNLSNTQNTGLGFLFGETKLETNHINKLTNFTLLNNEQSIAVKDSLENNLSVIVGPPGTGKSQVVVNIMLNAYINDKTILFASKNNTAVDTVLEKISKLDLSYYPFLRLGSKKSQDEWGPRISNKLRQNTTTSKLEYSKISQILENLSDLEGALGDIEKKYLDYYQSYEDLEIILNNYNEEFKNYLYKQDIIDIDFDSLKTLLREYEINIEKHSKYKEIFETNKEEIDTFLKENTSWKTFYAKIKEKQADKDSFTGIYSDISKIHADNLKLEKSFQKKSKELDVMISKNDYQKILKKGSEELQQILLQENFINYENFSIAELKIMLGEITEAQESGFIKRLFNLDKINYKKVRKKYLSIIENLNNELLKEYFFDISDNLRENNDIILKIKETIAVQKYENTYKNHIKYTSELQILGKEFKLKQELYNKEYQKNIKQLNELVQFNCSSKVFSDIQELFKVGNELFVLQGLYSESEKSFSERVNLLAGKNQEVLSFLSTHIDREISDYFIKGINTDNLESNIPNIQNILELEKISQQKSIIRYKFDTLKGVSDDSTNISKQILETQKMLKKVSLDYLSYKISDNIQDIKNKLLDSVEKIYNVFRFTKDWQGSKDKYLTEKFKKVFEGIKIFITTNLATKSLPLEEGFFDYLIIDEASQNDIASIIPLLYRVKNVIIIGDPNQLQNIVKLENKQVIKIFDTNFKKQGLEPSNYAEDFKDVYNFQNSVFTSFESIYKSQMNLGLIQLKGHYRCESDIINYSNFIIGEYDLFPKDHKKNKYLEDAGLSGIHWVGDIKTENIEITKRNEKEAEAIISYLKEIVSALGNKVTIGVIAPFRNQVNYIKKLIRDNGLEEYENILVDTVHKFQGDEKDIILFSTVYPNAKASTFLNDTNLLNVAVSRARNSFLIFGDKQAIKNYRSEKGEELLYTSLIHYIDALDKGKELVKYKKYDTEFEKIFFEQLELAGISFDYQHPIEGYNLDFSIKLKGANNYINIELDGGVHNKQKSYDYTRNTKVEKLGYKVIRYSNSYMIKNMGEIIEGLKKVCEIKK